MFDVSDLVFHDIFGNYVKNDLDEDGHATTFDFSDFGFHNIIVKAEDGETVIRSNVKNKDDVERWKEAYFSRSKIRFNIIGDYDSVKCILHERHCCLFGDQRHNVSRKIYTGCGVKMYIKIQNVTESTVYKDKLVGTHPCLITIKGTHNHDAESTTTENSQCSVGVAESFADLQESRLTASPAAEEVLPSTSGQTTLHKDCSNENVILGTNSDNEGSLLTEEDFHKGFGEAFDQFVDGETHKAIAVFIKRLKAVKSSSQFNSLLKSCGSCSIKMDGVGCEKTSFIATQQVDLPRGAVPLKGYKRKRIQDSS